MARRTRQTVSSATSNPCKRRNGRGRGKRLSLVELYSASPSDLSPTEVVLTPVSEASQVSRGKSDSSLWLYL
jgi:hypothetical protein